MSMPRVKKRFCKGFYKSIGMDYVGIFKGVLCVIGFILYLIFLWKPLKRFRSKVEYEDDDINYISPEVRDFSDNIYTWNGRIASVLLLLMGIYLIYEAIFCVE